MAKAPFALLSLFFTAAAIVLIFFVVLAGTRYSTPVDLVYFLRADTSGIEGARPLTVWTLWNDCGVSPNGRNIDCGAVQPAHAFDPQRNFPSTDGVPETFIGTKKFFYLSRFTFAFILIGLVFAVFSLFTGLLALCSRLGGALSGLLASFALFWQAAAAALMTACYVIARKNFRSDDITADLGKYGFGFMWAATASLLLATIFFFLVVGAGKNQKSSSSKSFFRRNKSTRSQGSFGSRKNSF
ncbi:MAG: hypothetical protein M1825_004796 [Sarcosagium campestre]|nr:MAG: hypothetical protein M1825_004796 [Sarcosagium campestre]